MSNLTTIITSGLNNPECAFYTGAIFGQWMVFKLVLCYFIVLFIMKAIDKLAWTPLIDWLKDKIYKNKNEKKKNLTPKA